jgi:predicted lipoprotein with Yx(FWY)xxD motif
MKNRILFISIPIFAPIIPGCVSAKTAAPAPVMPGGSAVVNNGKNSTLGSFLIDSKGISMYLFTKDSPNTSNCYNDCIGYWPPLLTNGTPIAGLGVTAAS